MGVKDFWTVASPCEERISLHQLRESCFKLIKSHKLCFSMLDFLYCKVYKNVSLTTKKYETSIGSTILTGTVIKVCIK